MLVAGRTCDGPEKDSKFATSSAVVADSTDAGMIGGVIYEISAGLDSLECAEEVRLLGEGWQESEPNLI